MTLNMQIKSQTAGFDVASPDGFSIKIKNMLKESKPIYKNFSHFPDRSKYDTMIQTNSVIGVDFDSNMLDSETSVIQESTVYLPSVFCAAANGTAVITEKSSDYKYCFETSASGFRQMIITKKEEE